MFNLQILHRKTDGCKVETIEEETYVSMIPGKKYILNNPVRTTFELPEIACVGETIIIEDIGTGGFVITQLENQQIQSGDMTTTYGITGKIESVDVQTTIQLSCVIKDLAWSVDYVTASAIDIS